jgi:hypothetical protein
MRIGAAGAAGAAGVGGVAGERSDPSRPLGAVAILGNGRPSAVKRSGERIWPRRGWLCGRTITAAKLVDIGAKGQNASDSRCVEAAASAGQRNAIEGNGWSAMAGVTQGAHLLKAARSQ